MDITFNCDKCGQQIVIDEAGAGQLVDCPKCAQHLTVPNPAPQRTTAVPPPQQASVAEMQRCPGCKEVSPAGKKNCPICGFDLGLYAARKTHPGMDFVRCPKCGNIVDKNAAHCPNCRAPCGPKIRKTGKLSPVFVATGVVLLSFLGWWAWMMQEELLRFFTPKSPSTEQNKPQLHASASRSTTTVTINNNDEFDYNNATVSVNVMAGDYYELAGQTIPRGQSASFALIQFSSRSGQRFDPYLRVVKNILLECDTPSGKVTWEGQWK